MKKIGVRLQYNAPVVLSFALLSLLVLLLGAFTGGKSTRLLFSVYRCSLADASGATVAERSFVLGNTIQPQAGVFPAQN